MSEIIGIDLGTTYSCVAVSKNGKIEVIANSDGNRITPSCVAFTDDERFIGEAAKRQYAANPNNTIYDAKRLIGRRFTDPTVQSDMKHWTFTVVNQCNKPKIRINLNGKNKLFFPEEISAVVLGQMKETAEVYLGHKVTKAVITVPAYFNDAQRKATKDAGEIASLEVVKIINEPTAAAIAYGLDKKYEYEGNILVFDLGGGTFDVSILHIENGTFSVQAVAGDSHLGGEDFNNNMVNYFLDLIKRQYNVKLDSDKKVIRRLRTACETAKKELSAQMETKISLDYLFANVNFEQKITRALFDDINNELFQSTLWPVERALQDANLSKEEIAEIVLVGGSTRIPKIQSILRDFFDGKKLNKDINPDEAVAYGAAFQGMQLAGETIDNLPKVFISDVTPLSMGTSVLGGLFSVVVERNTTIPCKRSQDYCTVEDYQTSILFKVYEGERSMSKDNHLLGEFQLNGIPPASRSTYPVTATFSIDNDGILNVSAVESVTGSRKAITIKNNVGHFTKAQIARMIKDAEIFKSSDAIQKSRAIAQNSLEEKMYRIRSALNKRKKSFEHDELDVRAIRNKCEQIKTWLLSKVRKEHEIETIRRDLKQMWRRIKHAYVLKEDKQIF